MVIQAIALLDTLDKDVNTFVMRVREWYGWHFPELVKVGRGTRAAGAALGCCAAGLPEARCRCFVSVSIVLAAPSTPAWCSAVPFMLALG